MSVVSINDNKQKHFSYKGIPSEKASTIDDSARRLYEET